MKNFVVVMAGGKGTRFWPESTLKKPKQYLSLVGDESLLGQTLMRFESWTKSSERFIVTTQDQEALCQESSKDYLSDQGLIFEPEGRNTAPCILLALHHLLQNGASTEDVAMIVPSDHVILDHEKFKNDLLEASKVATQHQKIVTIGIKPSFAHTGFGYIHRDECIEGKSFMVKGFKEKPNREVAEDYVKSGEYYWNAGMFVAPIGLLLNEFEALAPDYFKVYQKLQDSNDLGQTYGEFPSDSIDYVIMEKSDKIAVIEASFDWNDLGSWDAMEDVLEKTSSNTVVRAKDLVNIDASGNVVFSPNKVVCLVGVEDLIVVDNGDVTMVLPKNRSQDVKKLVSEIKEKHPDLL